MKSNIEKVYSKLPKQELTAQKVELGLVDDLDKLNTSYFSETDKANSKIKGILSEARGVESILEKAIKSAERIEPIKSKIEQQAKELGVDPKNISSLKGANIVLNNVNEYKQALATIKKFTSSI